MRQKLGKALFWVVAVLLTSVWLYTVIDTGLVEKKAGPIFSIAVVVICLFFLFWLEGFEAAYGDLRDKDPEQVDPRIQGLLGDMQESDPTIIGHRELLVVGAIALIGVVTSFQYIALPYFGIVRAHGIPEIFGLLFTSLVVFWFASVAAKTLALENPQAFLRYCSLIWYVVKRSSWSGLTAPSDALVRYLSRREPFSIKQSLAPSRVAFNDWASQRYGYAMDRLRFKILIRQDASCTIVQKGLIRLIEGRREMFNGSVALDSALCDAKFTSIRLMSVPLLNGKRQEAYKLLDDLFDERPLDPRIVALDRIVPRGAFSGLATKHLGWSIESPVPLPSGIRSAIGLDTGRPGGFEGAVLLYEVEVHGERGGFKLGGEPDSWKATLPFPCRRFDLEVCLDEAVPGRFARLGSQFTLDEVLHPTETTRLESVQHLQDRKINLYGELLLPGGGVTVSWEVWSLP
ncbi:MAG: hypothetical protein WA405_01535 [Candidatus Acidiferrales bacterium]